jgi:VanZ family protein
VNIFFSVLSAAYIAGIFLLADSPMVSDVAPINPYSLLHIPLYGILALLLILSFSSRQKKALNPSNPSNPSNPRNSSNLFVAGIIAFVVAIADEVHQAYLPNRNASVIDVLLDLIGIILCMFIIKRIEHMSGFLKVKGLLHRTKQ